MGEEERGGRKEGRKEGRRALCINKEMSSFFFVKGVDFAK
jgi:hypothetical protein